MTAPYMHDGRFASLGDVLAFYNTLDTQARRHHHAEDVLKPLNLEAAQLADLEAFLESLSGDQPASQLTQNPLHPPPGQIPTDQPDQLQHPNATKEGSIHE